MEFSGLKIRQRIVFFLSFALILLFISTALSAKVVFKKDPKLAMSMHMLRMAKEAHEAGDHHEAKRIWMQVRAISPALEEPAWLNTPAQVNDSEPQDVVWNRQRLILEIDQQGFTQEILERTEKWIETYPEDRLIRMLLLGHASLIGDKGEISRHKSLLKQPEPKSSMTLIVIKSLLSVILLALIIWQIAKLKKDFSKID